MRFYAQTGDVARLTALLERGIVNVKATDEGGRTALHLAAREGHPDCVEVLITKGADVMATDKVSGE